MIRYQQFISQHVFNKLSVILRMRSQKEKERHFEIEHPKLNKRSLTGIRTQNTREMSEGRQQESGARCQQRL